MVSDVMLALLLTRSEKKTMTNAEYEAACITQAQVYDKFEGEHRLKQCDEHIATLEMALSKAHEARREIVNFYNLNKCEHKNQVIMQGLHLGPGNPNNEKGYNLCTDCGAKL